MKKTGHLIWLTGPHEGESLTVPESGFSVGRGETNDLSIVDEDLSRTHCRFFFRAGQLWVGDVNSSNGTLMNGRRVESSPLQPGDRITIGAHEFKVIRDTPESGTRRKAGLAPPATPAPADATSPPKRRHIPYLAWIALILWWLLLAYSLFLPPPAPQGVENVSDVPQPVAALPVPAPVESTESTSPTETPQPLEMVADANPLLELKDAVAQHLAAEQYPAAEQLIQSNLASDTAPETQKALKALADYVTEVSTLDTRIAAAIEAKVGQRITLHQAGRALELRVRAMSGTRLSADLFDTNGERKVVLDLTKLSPAERRRWLGTPVTPTEHAMHFVLALKSGTKSDAQAQAEAAGLLAEAFQKLLGSPM